MHAILITTRCRAFTTPSHAKHVLWKARFPWHSIASNRENLYHYKTIHSQNFLLPPANKLNFRRHAFFTKTILNNQIDSQSQDGIISETFTSSENHLYEAWTLEHDKFLYEHRNESIPKLASILGRGLRGVQSRLRKLQDVNSPAYTRLFVNGDNNNSNKASKNDETESEKRPALVPAMEVLRRIRWDTTLTASDFSVLHYDRVEEKICESNFNDPNTSVKGRDELFVFAIPEHRIESIKYKERVVWDKQKRLDCVFGSMNGDGERIETVLQNYNEWKRNKDEENESSRLRQIDVSRRMKVILGDDGFNLLKQESGFLMTATCVDYELKDSIHSYVQYAFRLFKSANAEKQNEQASPKQQDLESMYLFSELVALLPREDMREYVLTEVESLIARLEGKKQKPQKGSALPDLIEEEIEEKFIKGSGAGGQKVCKRHIRV